MSQLEQLNQPPIEPLYQQDSPNVPIEFGEIQASIGDQSDKVSGHARLRFTPQDSVELVIPTLVGNSGPAAFKSMFKSLGPETVKIHLLNYGGTFDAQCRSTSSEKSVYVPMSSPVQVRPTSTSISKAVFHLVNWPDFSGPETYVLRTGTPPLQGAISCGRFTLEVDGWKVTVAAIEETSSLVKTLKETGGYVITHVGSVERTDGQAFSTEELDKLLSFLSYLFSFVLGCWTSPTLAVGFDEDGNRVYENWGLGRRDSGPWRGSFSWFDERHAEVIPAVLPGFWKLWSNDVWHRSLTEAIYWYTSANRGGAGLGVDSALLFTQAALELLSWTYCVLDQKLEPAKRFKPGGLSASDKLRRLISSLDIPLEIPERLDALHSKTGKKWTDSMHAITDLRNGLVHPGKNATVPEGAYSAAWRLSMWYLDLVLLRLCEYSGNYANRLSERWVGQVEPVPWV